LPGVSNSFPKAMRLRKRREFLAVQRSGKPVPGSYFLVVVQPGGTGRIGITVSKKVGKAVVRNRIKRAVREFVRTAKDWLPSGADVVVISRAKAAHASTRELWSDLAGLEGALC
jgi:ribonuclease P protein component